MTTTATRPSKPRTRATSRPTTRSPRVSTRTPSVLTVLLGELDERTIALAFEALVCRLGHDWQPYEISLSQMMQLASRGLAEDTEQCSRCKSFRHAQRYFPSMVRIGQYRYEFSDGYLLSEEFQGLGRLTKDQVRQAVWARRATQMLNGQRARR